MLALARTGTLSAAGARLGVDPSTVSRRLDALEEALGVRLFARSSDGFAPTPAGTRMVTHAELVEQAAHGLGRELDNLETAPVGVVRITAPPGVVEYFVAPAMKALLARYPELRVELDASVAYADLTRREADIAIRTSRPTSGDLVAKRLHRYPLVPLGRGDWVRSLPTLRALHDVPWIAWSADLAHLPEAKWVDAHVPAERVVLRSSSAGAQVTAATAGVGLALLPQTYLRRFDLAEPRYHPALRRRLADLPHGELWLVGHRALQKVPRIKAVWDDLADTKHGAFARAL